MPPWRTDPAAEPGPAVGPFRRTGRSGTGPSGPVPDRPTTSRHPRLRTRRAGDRNARPRRSPACPEGTASVGRLGRATGQPLGRLQLSGARCPRLREGSRVCAGWRPRRDRVTRPPAHAPTCPAQAATPPRGHGDASARPRRRVRAATHPRGHGAWPAREWPGSRGCGSPGPSPSPGPSHGRVAACNRRSGAGARPVYDRSALAYARPDRVGGGRPPPARPRRPAALSSEGDPTPAPPTAPLSRVVRKPLTRSQRQRNTDSASESALPPFSQPGTIGLRASPGGWLRRASPVPLSPHRVPDVRGRRAAWRSAWPKESAEAPWCPP